MATLKGVRKWIYRFGIFLCLFGLCLVCVGIASIVVKSRLHNIGHGIFTGVFSMAVGALCVYFRKVTNLKCVSFLLVVMALVGSCIVCPVCLLLFMGEIVADTTAHYYDDPPMCKEGCDYNTGLNGFEIEFDDESKAMALKFDCEGSLWKNTCTDNLSAVYNAMAGSVFVLSAWALHVFVVAFGFTILCLCCGVKDETVKPYEGSLVHQYNQYPVAYPCDDMTDTAYYGYAERTALFPKVDEKIAGSPDPDQYMPGHEELNVAHRPPSAARPESISPEMISSPPPNPPNIIM